MNSYTKTQFLNHHHNHHHHHQQEDHNSGLLRFRSAPSSLFNEFTQTPNDFNKFTANFGDEICERKPQMVDLEQSNSHFLAPQYPKLSCGLNLNRQNSSPAGFFNQLNTQDGYTIMRGLGNFRVGNGTNVESSPHISRLNMNHLPRIPELANENVKETSTGVKFRNLENDSGFDSSPTGYAFVSWNDSTSDASHLSENDGLANPSVLSRHLSLPKTSSEMAAVEKLRHFQDVVPCKVRAKRGCATHPRSIAERMRRNRISDRMRKLQELVPNMDKQINTSDMLDLAVDYIKILQNQYKVLSDNRAKCKCVK